MRVYMVVVAGISASVCLFQTVHCASLSFLNVKHQNEDQAEQFAAN